MTRSLKDFFSSQWEVKENTGHIYAIMRQGNHLQLTSLGNAGIPLVKENYTPKVIEEYQYVIRDWQSESPSGRIAIFRGLPGGGKTHLVRDMLLAVPDAMHVIINPEMITSLDGPELLPLLMDHRGTTTGPINIILEDADKCLVSREKGSMNAIQSLLNLGDGILGTMLDLRIVATTNANELQMEEAIMRPGRLSKMIEVGSLDPLTAQRCFKRLCPNVNLPVQINGSTNPKSFKMTLAEVYALARQNGWVSAPRKVRDEEDWDD